MHIRQKVLAHIPLKKKYRISDIHGGRHFHRRLCIMGIRIGQEIEVVTKQPFRGPLTIKIGNCTMTIGRGMAHRILVEEI